MSSTPTEQEPTRSRLPRPAAAPAPASSTQAPEAERTDIISRIRRWVNGVITEVKKVTWPTPTETRNLTIVVIGISVTVGAILGLVDLLLTALTRWVATGTF